MRHPTDIHVGKLIRLRRQYLRMSQEGLGNALGLTFQQVQKYEIGQNRVSASRLFDIAGALRVPITFFFDGLPHGAAASRSPKNPAVDLIRLYNALPDEERRAFLGMIAGGPRGRPKRKQP
jgi:transcriptional regulator with XRE-family HTH domain